MRTHVICLALALALVSLFASAQWIQVGTGLTNTDVRSFAISGKSLFAGTLGGVFRSTNNGTSWTASNLGLTDTVVCALAVHETSLFAGTYGGSIFRSTNGGVSWAEVKNSLPSSAGMGDLRFGVSAFAADSADLFAGTSSGVFFSTDDGQHWTATDTGMATATVRALGLNGHKLFAGTSDGVFLTTNSGRNWTAVNANLSNKDVHAISVSGTSLFAGCITHHMKEAPSGGVFLSMNNGGNWSEANNGLSVSCLRHVFAFAVDGANFFAGTSGGVFLTTNSGESWTNVNNGLPNPGSCLYILALAVDGVNLFAGTLSDGVWRRPLSEMVTSVSPEGRELPDEYGLSPNYPNPFNPSTTIKYELPKSSVVRVSLFDMLGREIAVLVDETRNAGTYEVQFEGEGLSSGVYFYQLRAGDFVSTKRMSLVK
jgi:photosystem II stability/assembly factor-like uncharacterized protein